MAFLSVRGVFKNAHAVFLKSAGRSLPEVFKFCLFWWCVFVFAARGPARQWQLFWEGDGETTYDGAACVGHGGLHRRSFALPEVWCRQGRQVHRRRKRPAGPGQRTRTRAFNSPIGLESRPLFQGGITLLSRLGLHFQLVPYENMGLGEEFWAQFADPSRWYLQTCFAWRISEGTAHGLMTCARSPEHPADASDGTSVTCCVHGRGFSPPKVLQTADVSMIRCESNGSQEEVPEA